MAPFFYCVLGRLLYHGLIDSSPFLPPSYFPNPPHIFYFSNGKVRVYAFYNGSGLMIDVIFTTNVFCCVYFSDMECEKPTITFSYDENNHVLFYDKSV